MNTLFLTQYSCLLTTGILAMALGMSRVHVKWPNTRYEQSRWMLFSAMLVLAAHFALQIAFGLRASGDDVGAVVNILFFTPASFLISYAVLNIEASLVVRRRYVWVGVGGYLPELAVFLAGYLRSGSLHIGWPYQVMHVWYVLCMVAFILVPLLELRRRHRRISDSTAGDMVPYVRYSKASLAFLCISALVSTFAISSRAFLYIIAPVVFFSIFFMVLSFVALSYSIEPVEEFFDTSEENDTGLGTLGPSSAELAPAPQTLPEARVAEIRKALDKWSAEGNFRESTVTIASLARFVRISRHDLTLFFEQHLHTTFRVWLSDLRFKEVQRMLREYPEYSNDIISAECGFSSRAHLYRIFKQKTGLTPGEWKNTI